jgi:hypothetical protein
MRHPIRLIAVALLVTSAGCEKKAEPIQPPELGQAFSTLYVPPNSTLESKSGSADALQVVFNSTDSAGAIASFYRRQFSQPGWTIVGDLRDSTGAINLHVEWAKTRQPMWIRIEPVGRGSRVGLTGAVPGRDSAYVRRTREAAETTNTFRPR